MTTLELLAPARDASVAKAAIRHGADAVYIGADAFGARAAAVNSLDDIAEVVKEAHPYGVKVYVTINTIIFENEIEKAASLICELWRIGVDALIVQDMAVLEMDIPPIELHASTQADARTLNKIRWLAEAGFSQIVVPREFSLNEIQSAAEAASPAKIEVFVHGALCVSYSGDCHAGAVLTGRSANRGECPQLCRLKYTLTDSRGRKVEPPDGKGAERHWLSLADLNRLDRLADLAEAGASSFKIEGRLKGADYVKNVTQAYSDALDKLVAMNPERYRRSSFGTLHTSLRPDPEKSFNRGFSTYFIDGKASGRLTSWLTPKWIGREIGKVTGAGKNYIDIQLNRPADKINNGDGLGFFRGKEFTGFRVNRVEGSRLFPAPGSSVPSVGSTLYRNNDSAWQTILERDDTARRSININVVMRHLPDGRIAADVSDERGCCATVTSDGAFNDAARSSQEAQRKEIFGRLGDTVYSLDSLTDRLGTLFVPAKDLTALRRKAVSALDRCWNIMRPRPLRRPSSLASDSLEGTLTTYHDNIANSLARKFYASHGAEIGEDAAEVSMPRGEVRVMTTRYCLRREACCCLKEQNADKLPRDLYLEAPVGRLRLCFDCKNCRMQLYTSTLEKTKKNNKSQIK